MVRRKTDNRDDRESLIRREFGLQVREEMALVKARVLPSPLVINYWSSCFFNEFLLLFLLCLHCWAQLKYHDSGREKSVYPQMGQWNMTNKVRHLAINFDFWGTEAALHQNVITDFFFNCRKWSMVVNWNSGYLSISPVYTRKVVSTSVRIWSMCVIVREWYDSDLHWLLRGAICASNWFNWLVSLDGDLSRIFSAIPCFH